MRECGSDGPDSVRGRDEEGMEEEEVAVDAEVGWDMMEMEEDGARFELSTQNFSANSSVSSFLIDE